MIKPQHFAGLAVAALTAVILAFGLNSYYDSWTVPQVTGEALAPSLDKQINNAALIEMRQGDKAIVLERASVKGSGDKGAGDKGSGDKGDTWSVKDRGGYVADAARVATFVRHLAATQLVEPRTRSKDRFGLLELDEPGTKESKSRHVRVLDAKGGVLADVLLGKSKHEAFGAGRSGVFARRFGDAQTWLASGDPRASFDIKDWVAASFFVFDVAKLKRMTYEHPGDSPLVAEKGAEKDARFKLVEPVPAGKKLKDGAQVENFPVAFANLELDDVRKLAATPAGDGVSVIRLEADNGVIITLRVRKEGDAHWLSYAAAGEGEAKKQADEITARGQGWEFKLPPWKVDAVMKKRDNLYEAVAG